MKAGNFDKMGSSCRYQLQLLSVSLQPVGREGHRPLVTFY